MVTYRGTCMPDPGDVQTTLMQIQVFEAGQVLVESAELLENLTTKEAGGFHVRSGGVAASLQDLAAGPETFAEGFFGYDDCADGGIRHAGYTFGNHRGGRNHVRVQETHVFAARHGESVVSLRAALGTAVLNPNVQSTRNFYRAISGTIVHQDNFRIRIVLIEQTSQAVLNVLPLVARCDNEGYQVFGWRKISLQTMTLLPVGELECWSIGLLVQEAAKGLRASTHHSSTPIHTPTIQSTADHPPAKSRIRVVCRMSNLKHRQ